MDPHSLLLLSNMTGEPSLLREAQLTLGGGRAGEGHPGHIRCPLWMRVKDEPHFCNRMQLAFICSPQPFSHRLYAACNEVLDTAPSLRELKTPSPLESGSLGCSTGLVRM